MSDEVGVIEFEFGVKCKAIPLANGSFNLFVDGQFIGETKRDDLKLIAETYIKGVLNEKRQIKS